MIVDARCRACGHVVEDILVKSEQDIPACPQCSAEMERLWTLRPPRDGRPANESSLRFHFNYLEP